MAVTDNTIIDWTGGRHDHSTRNFETEPSTVNPDFQEQLNREAAFDLGGHELVEPTIDHGYVSGLTELDPVSLKGEKLPTGVRLFEIRVVDPFVAADPEGYSIVRNHVERLERLIRREGFNPLEERTKDHPYMTEDGDQQVQADTQDMNMFTRAWLNQENLRPLKAWHSNVPSARALGYLSNPSPEDEITELVGPKKVPGEVFKSTPETAAFLRFVDDAVAIRDRAVAMEAIAGNVLSSADPSAKLGWLSLASGTGEPSIVACKNASEALGVDIELTVADLDPESLKFVNHLAEKHGFSQKVNTVLSNILSPKFAERLEKKAGRRKFRITENTGFQEYLFEPGDEMGAFKDLGFPHASVFAGSAYEFTEPGGASISGNMVNERPQIFFVFGAVDWPIINARSEESMLRIYQNAGIPMNQIKMYRVRNEQTGAHVYNIIEITKPAETRRDQIRKSAVNLIGRLTGRQAVAA